MIDIAIPGDKSISHRSLIMATLASGTSRVRGLLVSEDVSATALCLRELGAPIPPISEDMRIVGLGLRGLQSASQPLACANSGTTARLLMGVVAGQGLTADFSGDESLGQRPMQRVIEPLKLMGASFEWLGAADRLPLRVRGGTLHPIDYTSPRSSAQVKSAVLLAALTAGVRVAFSEPVLSRDHTERMLNAQGMQLRTVVERGGMRIELDPVEALEPLDIRVPADLSSAAFFLARGLLADAPVRVTDVGVNATRSGFLDVLRRMHGVIDVEARAEFAAEPVATLIARRSELVATRIEGHEVPRLVDEIPIIAAMATRAHGSTEIVGAGELRVKESDRLTAMVDNLRTIGSFGDHRIAMAFGVLASLPGNEIRIDDKDVVSVSFPDFWQQLAACA
jgi:3-phosphoshikimate 1-carboxyvinyltransferase